MDKRGKTPKQLMDAAKKRKNAKNDVCVCTLIRDAHINPDLIYQCCSFEHTAAPASGSTMKP